VLEPTSRRKSDFLSGNGIIVVYSGAFYRATACNATHGIVKAFLPVRPCVCLSNTCIVTKRKKFVSTFPYHMKDHSS